MQRKGERREICKTNGQNARWKTETCPHDKRILTIHMAFNCSNIKTVINTQYTEYEALNEFVLISSKRWENEQRGQLMNRKFMVVVTRRSSFTLRRRYVTDGAMVTEWAVISKQRFCNALAIEHKCSTSFPINEAHNYKREDNKS